MHLDSSVLRPMLSQQCLQIPALLDVCSFEPCALITICSRDRALESLAVSVRLFEVYVLEVFVVRSFKRKC